MVCIYYVHGRMKTMLQKEIVVEDFPDQTGKFSGCSDCMGIMLPIWL